MNKDINLTAMTDAEIRTLLDATKKEYTSRREAQKEQLVKAFQKAFKDLVDAGFEVWYHNSNYPQLEDVSRFEFSDSNDDDD